MTKTECELLDSAFHCDTLIVETEHGTLRGRSFGKRHLNAAKKLRDAGRFKLIRSTSTTIRHAVVFTNTWKLVTR